MNSAGMENRLQSKVHSLFIVGKVLIYGYALLFTFSFLSSVFIILANETAVEKNRIGQMAVSLDTFAYQNYFAGFLYLLYYIDMFLATIVEHLDELLKVEGKMKENDVIETLKVVRILFDKISDTMENLQRCYLINTIVFMIYFTFSTIFAIFGVITNFLIDSLTRNYVSVMLIIWTFYNFPFVIGTFFYSSRIKREGRKLHAVCFKFLYQFGSNSNLKVCKSVQTLSLQVHHRRPLLSCGLFVVDWYFLFHIIGLIFSFLLIFIQFEIQM